MPNDLFDFLSQFESISKTGEASKGQGYDFILEEDNKEVKKWIKRGVASDKAWLVVCRNKDKLQKLRSQLFDELSLSDQDSSQRNINLSPSIADWRLCLRQSNYLTDDSELLSSLEGGPLDYGLKNFTLTANQKDHIAS